MKINAFAVRERGQLLTPWTYETPGLQPHEVLIKVRACGICHSDVHMMDNDWQMTRYPLVPGHEAVGEIIERGSAVTQLKNGARVGVGWQRSACGECEDCLSGRDNMCDQSTGVISHGYGGFADHLVMDSCYCFPIPDEIATEFAGPLMCGGITVYGGLRAAGMGSGLRIGVVGVGGLGHLAVQFASRMGNLVTAITTSADKAEEAAKLGAHDAILIKQGELSKRPARPFHIIVNTAPVATPADLYLNLLGADGVLCYVGAPVEPISVQVFSLLLKRRRLMGSPIGSRALILEMLENAARFGVRPTIETFPLAEVNTAIEKVRRNTIRYRAVLMV